MLWGIITKIIILKKIIHDTPSGKDHLISIAPPIVLEPDLIFKWSCTQPTRSRNTVEYEQVTMRF